MRLQSILKSWTFTMLFPEYLYGQLKWWIMYFNIEWTGKHIGTFNNAQSLALIWVKIILNYVGNLHTHIHTVWCTLDFHSPIIYWAPTASQVCVTRGQHSSFFQRAHNLVWLKMSPIRPSILLKSQKILIFKIYMKYAEQWNMENNGM